MSKLWGGRFNSKTNTNLKELNCSLPVDCRLYAEDIDGSKAYTEILKDVGLLTPSECNDILKGLELVRYDWIEGLIQFQDTDEDVHTVNERRLIEIIGKVGEKLHTGRSRNDQVITDMRLWIRKAIIEMKKSLNLAIEAHIKIAEMYEFVLMPGYTHLQRAQPIKFSHWILSHAFALHEDCLRLIDYERKSDILPLGSGALAGNPFNIDRNLLAKKLGFTKVTQNSMHAVGDRDFIVEFIFILNMIGIHLSRLAEDLIIYATKEFNFVKISDEYSTGSSLMPQKRNPDSLELIRGLSGKIFASLTGLMMTIKGTPSTYNKDLQMDKNFIFDSFDYTKKSLNVITGVLMTLKINEDSMLNSLSSDMLATDLAYYLVRKGIPFRTAHHTVGKVVSHAEELHTDLAKLDLENIPNVSDFDSDVKKIFDYNTSIEQYNVLGGTGSLSIKKQIKFLENFLKTF